MEKRYMKAIEKMVKKVDMEGNSMKEGTITLVTG